MVDVSSFHSFVNLQSVQKQLSNYVLLQWTAIKAAFPEGVFPNVYKLDHWFCDALHPRILSYYFIPTRFSKANTLFIDCYGIVLSRHKRKINWITCVFAVYTKNSTSRKELTGSNNHCCVVYFMCFQLILRIIGCRFRRSDVALGKRIHCRIGFQISSVWHKQKKFILDVILFEWDSDDESCFLISFILCTYFEGL